jgi:hypothetical protein
MRLADRLDALRFRQFVGRSDELTRFADALKSTELPFYVIHIYGPGGIGKTTLLKNFMALCQKHDAVAVYLDTRNIEPVPAGFLHALAQALDAPDNSDITDVLAARSKRHVLLLDTFETFAPIDAWLREEFLPQLSENVMLVTAGRNAPPHEWRIDPGWQSLVHIIPLRNLSPDESRQLLAVRNIPAEQHERLLDFTHGHPLALSLVADMMAQRPGMKLDRESVPDVVKTLLEQFVEKVPGPAHRAALEACALVRVMTEALLAEMVARTDVHELFEWLRSLSFIESGKDGLFPHDLAREALAVDLRWRNPDWYVELHHRARAYYSRRLQSASSQDQQRILYDYVFLHRDNSIMRAIFQWQGGSSILADHATENDFRALEEMVRTHEGEESAQLAAYWFRKQPEGILAIREPGGRPVGLLMMLRLHLLTDSEREYDPATSAMWKYLNRNAPLRSGEGATAFRFWLAEEGYQAVSPVQSIVFVNVGRHYLTEPGLAYTFFPCSDPDFWQAGFDYIDLHRLPEADFRIGNQEYGVYGHDWRVVTPLRWLAILADREIGVTPAPTPDKALDDAIVLSEDSFAEAVRDALRSYSDIDELQKNPLLRSRMILDMTPGEGLETRVKRLKELIRDAGEKMQSIPRGEKYYRAIERTYFRPVATQERAAELLSLPFSTYRRHLTSGIDRISKQLWNLEIGWSDDQLSEEVSMK